MYLHIKQSTIYNFDGKVNSGYQRIILTPKNSDSQKIKNWNVKITGGKKELQVEDHFQNIVNLIRVNSDVKTIAIEVEGKVETYEKFGIIKYNKNDIPLWCYTQQSKLTRSGKNIFKLRSLINLNNKEIIKKLHLLSNIIREKVKYVKDSTNYKTTAEDSLKLKKGVCQDHTHIFISLVRSFGIAARYVSVFFIPNIIDKNLSMHSWAEVFVENLGWIGFDVSNGISPDDRYVIIARGFDYNDVVPIKGIIRGTFSETHYSKISIKKINNGPKI